MNEISFNKLDLFSKKQGKHPKKGENGLPPNQQPAEASFWEKIGQSPILYMILGILCLSYFLSHLPSTSLPVPKEGEIAASDFVAPADMTIPDQETTEKRQREAVDRILPVYRLDQNALLAIEERIKEFFNFGRLAFKDQVNSKNVANFQKDVSGNYDFQIPSKDLNYLIKTKFSAGIEDNLVSLVGKVSESGIIASKHLFIHNEDTKGLTLIKAEGDERVIRTENLMDIPESKKALSAEIAKLDLPQSEKSVLNTLSYAFVTQNIRYDPIETQNRQDLARKAVGTVFYTIKKGKVIVRKGDEVSAGALKEIQIINQNIQAKPSWMSNFAGTFILLALLLLTSWYYLKSLHNFKYALRLFKMLILMLIISVLIYKLSLFLATTFSESSKLPFFQTAESYRFAFPFQMGVLIFAFLAASPIALIYTVINSLIAAYFLHADFYLMIFGLVGGFAALYGIKHYGKQKRTTPFQAGVFMIAPINIILIIAAHLIRDRLGSIELFTSEILMSVIGGLLSAVMAFLFLPIFETIFGFLTQSKLLELSNSDLPIFKEMAIKAPGTYHHSLIVASLASEAAKEIGLDPMLVKAGALYHDNRKKSRGLNISLKTGRGMRICIKTSSPA